MEEKKEMGLFDQLRGQVMELIYHECNTDEDYRDEANMMWIMFHTIDQIEYRLNDLDKSVSDYRKRAIRAEMALKQYEEKES